MARCPGQDQRFWKPDDIFDVKCPACGTLVEFWKDEPQVKCPSCKQVIINPKLDLGCAKWCKYAEECLGQIASQENTILSNKLIECLRQIASSDQNLIRYSLEVLCYAEKIQLKEGGDPLVVKASAILSQIYKRPVQTGAANSDENTTDNQDVDVRDILAKYGIKNELIDHVCRILIARQSGQSINSLEFNIIGDSCRLAQLHQLTTTTDETAATISWKTRTAQQLAREIFEK
ncbi:MAG: HD domain-containing protein [Planctomycetota bacterium]|jgi:HD superfamily phosphodiesterase